MSSRQASHHHYCIKVSRHYGTCLGKAFPALFRHLNNIGQTSPCTQGHALWEAAQNALLAGTIRKHSFLLVSCDFSHILTNLLLDLLAVLTEKKGDICTTGSITSLHDMSRSWRNMAPRKVLDLPEAGGKLPSPYLACLEYGQDNLGSWSGLAFPMHCLRGLQAACHHCIPISGRGRGTD